MPNGTEGQIWTAGSDGVGVWQDDRGGEIETEYYAGLVEDAELVSFGFAPSESITLTASSSSSMTWYIYESDTEKTGDGIYYDTENNLMKRCIKELPVASYSGTFTTSRVGTSTNYDSTNALHTFLVRKLVRKKINCASSSAWLLSFRVLYNNSLYGVLQVSVSVSNKTISTIKNVQWYSTSASRTLNASPEEIYTFSLVYNSGYGVVPYTEGTVLPTTYQRVSGGFLADDLSEVISGTDILRDFEVMYVDDANLTGWIPISKNVVDSALSSYKVGAEFGPVNGIGSYASNEVYSYIMISSGVSVRVNNGNASLVTKITSSDGSYYLIRY